MPADSTDNIQTLTDHKRPRFRYFKNIPGKRVSPINDKDRRNRSNINSVLQLKYSKIVIGRGGPGLTASDKKWLMFTEKMPESVRTLGTGCKMTRAQRVKPHYLIRSRIFILIKPAMISFCAASWSVVSWSIFMPGLRLGNSHPRSVTNIRFRASWKMSRMKFIDGYSTKTLWYWFSRAKSRTFRNSQKMRLLSLTSKNAVPVA